MVLQHLSFARDVVIIRDCRHMCHPICIEQFLTETDSLAHSRAKTLPSVCLLQRWRCRFGWSNGSVFHAGPSVAMHWFDTTGSGRVLNASRRGTDTDAMNGAPTCHHTNSRLICTSLGANMSGG